MALPIYHGDITSKSAQKDDEQKERTEKWVPAEMRGRRRAVCEG